MSNPWVSFLRIDIAYWGWPLIWARNTDASQRGRALRILTICGSSNPAERSLPSTEVPGSDLAKDLQEYVEVRNTVDPSIYAYLCLSMPMLSQTCGTGSAEGVRRVPSSTTNPMRALVAGLFLLPFSISIWIWCNFSNLPTKKNMPCSCFMAPSYRPVHGEPFAACIASTCGCATRGTLDGPRAMGRI